MRIDPFGLESIPFPSGAREGAKQGVRGLCVLFPQLCAAGAAGIGGYALGTIAYPHIAIPLGDIIDKICSEDSEEARCKKVLKECRQKCLDAWVDQPSSLPSWARNAPGRLRRCTRECMEAQGCFNY
jgi:hypothetical protein